MGELGFPSLNGGARVGALLDRMDKDLAEGCVPLAIFNDDAVFEAELDRIFGCSWMFLAHESELPGPGDYVRRYIGLDPWIVCRDDSGKVHVLFDSCTHHGTQVCRGDKGTASEFRCPYHGWTYNTAGELIGIPHRREAYKQIEVAAHGLRAAPRMEIYGGLIFASLASEGPSLGEHLGDFRWYLDIHLAPGMEVIGDPHRWRIEADWKTGAENFSGDSYHTQSLHKSISEKGLIPRGGVGTGGSFDVHITDISGHATSMRRTGPGTDTFFGYPEALRAQFAGGRLSREQLELAAGSLLHTGNMFPNLSFIHMPAVDAPDKVSATSFSLRQWQPRGPGRMEAWSWVLVPAGASEEYRQRAYKTSVASFSPSGNFEQDDTVVWGSIARAGRSILARRGMAKLNYQMGMEGMSNAKVIPDWPGPGIAYNSNLEEGVQRTFFRSWWRAMAQGSGR